MNGEDSTANPAPETLRGRSPEEVETVAAILVEVRDTAPDSSKDHIGEMIRARLERAGIDLSESEVAELATQLTEGTD